jgi:tyrosyl-tRNA synthetase
MFHNDEAAFNAIANHGKINKFGLPEVSIKRINGHGELAVIMTLHLGIASKSEAKRLVSQGAIKINGKKMNSPDEKPDIQPGDIIQIGKLKFFKFVS